MKLREEELLRENRPDLLSAERVDTTAEQLEGLRELWGQIREHVDGREGSRALIDDLLSNRSHTHRLDAHVLAPLLPDDESATTRPATLDIQVG